MRAAQAARDLVTCSPEVKMTISILRLPAVVARTGLSRSTIYARISEGDFPKAIPLGHRAVGWAESEIDEWLQGKIRARAERESWREIARNASPPII